MNFITQQFKKKINFIIQQFVKENEFYYLAI